MAVSRVPVAAVDGNAGGLRPRERMRTDVFISGGGIAGLTAAASLGAIGLDVICADPSPDHAETQVSHSDLRTTAILQPAAAVLRDAGVWERLADDAVPLRTLRIADAGESENRIQYQADYLASEISGEPFGWNVPNPRIRLALRDRLSALPNVTILSERFTRAIVSRNREAIVVLSDGSEASCRLLIGADGRRSRVRRALGIGARVWHYGQKALACCVVHEHPHDNVSTEIYRSGGAFTLVPMADDGDRPQSALVWMDSIAEVERRQSLPETEFDRELNDRSYGAFGTMALSGPRSAWPVIGMLADGLIGRRTALVAETAHVVPPIGAQGLNMSLTDIRCLVEQARAYHDDPGSPDALRQYNRSRWLDIRLRTGIVDMLNRAARARSPTARVGRLKALQCLHSGASLRRSMMKFGLGSG
ncbi:MAG: FAD-dependent monooxygenase [Paracoccaceae bacterium]|nr:FAD-dependent monooxygenase [Paracoccaceae bacterium]MDE2911450.1 FAD-dependent monooxygenase [Paracoccaceae bacterium]